MMMFGDLLVNVEPPTKFLDALAVIADHLHPLFDAEPWIAYAGRSKGNCVLSSLAIRDFLWKVGFKDAEVRPVVMAMQAFDGAGKKTHSAICGHPDMEVVRRQFVPGGDWPGHLVVAVPSVGCMIDTTLYQAQREQWPNLPGMVANPIASGPDAEFRIFDLPLLSALEEVQGDGSTFECVWLDHPANRIWREAGDASHRGNRANVVKQMVTAFRR